MKQYTNREQTAKLIELGFSKPKGGITKRVSYFDDKLNRKCRYEISEFNYTIGELIEMLPKNEYPYRRLEFDGFHWLVDWDAEEHFMQTMRVELIDALYDMVVKLKELGVI